MVHKTAFIATLLLLVQSTNAQQWALPHISAAHVRTEPRHGSEMSTQALMGTPLKILSITDNGWAEIEMPDGYHGFIIDNSITTLDEEAFTNWKKSPRLLVTSPEETKLYADTTANPEIISDLVAGDILEGRSGQGWVKATLPDKRQGWIRSDKITALDSAYIEDAADKILAIAGKHIGTPYLWGGLSSKGMDCSGLVKMAFYSTGRILLRDASQQANTGTAVTSGEYHKGDLLFFGNSDGRINHVGIYDSDGYFIESSGRVKRTLLSDKEGYAGARRILGNEGTEGITRLNDHPWYFLIEKRAVN